MRKSHPPPVSTSQPQQQSNAANTLQAYFQTRQIRRTSIDTPTDETNTSTNTTWTESRHYSTTSEDIESLLEDTAHDRTTTGLDAILEGTAGFHMSKSASLDILSEVALVRQDGSMNNSEHFSVTSSAGQLVSLLNEPETENTVNQSPQLKQQQFRQSPLTQDHKPMFGGTSADIQDTVNRTVNRTPDLPTNPNIISLTSKFGSMSSNVLNTLPLRSSQQPSAAQSQSFQSKTESDVVALLASNFSGSSQPYLPSTMRRPIQAIVNSPPVVTHAGQFNQPNLQNQPTHYAQIRQQQQQPNYQPQRSQLPLHPHSLGQPPVESTSSSQRHIQPSRFGRPKLSSSLIPKQPLQGSEPIIIESDTDPSKPFMCGFPACGSYCVRHWRMHSGARPYECLDPGCGQRFSRRDNMLHHFRKVHGGVMGSIRGPGTTSTDDNGSATGGSNVDISSSMESMSETESAMNIGA